MMMKITHIKRVVATVAIRINNAVRRHLPCNERHQGDRFGVVHHFGEYFSTTLEYAKYHHFTRGTAASLSLARATKITFIQLDCAIKYLMRLQLYMVADYLPNLFVKQHRRIGLDTQYICRCSGSNFQHKKFQNCLLYTSPST